MLLLLYLWLQLLLLLDLLVFPWLILWWWFILRRGLVILGGRGLLALVLHRLSASRLLHWCFLNYLMVFRRRWKPMAMFNLRLCLAVRVKWHYLVAIVFGGLRPSLPGSVTLASGCPVHGRIWSLLWLWVHSSWPCSFPLWPGVFLLEITSDLGVAPFEEAANGRHQSAGLYKCFLH